MGKEVDYSVSAPTPVVKKNIDTTAIETSDIKFGYCTEFIINLEVPFGEEDEDELKAFLSSIGDSLVAVHMDDIVKVHVHTNHPGQAFEKGLTYGSLTSMKVDNMREEHNEKVILEADKRLAAEQEAKAEAAPVSDIPRKETGFVTVCSGEGLVQVFKNMDVDAVIEGGQTMNPSTEDIVAAINTVNADNVYVLPNNSNIIMTAEQTKYLCEDKNIFVIPSKTVAQGINAVINYMPSLSPEENAAHMTESLTTVKTAEVTYAIRDTELDGIVVKNGDYMGIGEGHLLAASDNITEAVLRTVKAMGDEDSELITVYYGAEIESDAAEEIGESIEALFPDADVVVIEGGQPVYYYIISIE
ncbi:MAG: DAK2 domain-containing protein, partial [Parasporobacterium sp.]|nr:DAK2 domain-containing protein [Parasporobacterium sp.]